MDTKTASSLIHLKHGKHRRRSAVLKRVEHISTIALVNI